MDASRPLLAAGASAAGTPPHPARPATDKKRATIKDVAQRAGVHFTTVSLALRDHPSIPEVTRARIRQAAAELGYERNPVFAALTRFHVNGHARVAAPRIAYIVNRALARGSPFHAHQHAIFEGAQRQARALGYDLEEINVGDDQHDSRTIEKHLRSHQIGGVIVADFEPGFASLSLSWNDYAIVKINSRHMAPDATLVSNDHLQDVRLAFRHLAALGYRRIGLAVSRADEESTNHRQTAGFFVEQVALPETQRIPPLLFPLNPARADMVHSLGRWARQHEVDAVLSSWPNIDELLAAARFRVPQQIACASLAILHARSRVAGIRPDLHTVGVKAISLLAAQLKSGERGVPEFASTTYVQSRWQDGPTAPRQT